jgi:competence ComEA-like helix-hairpin-helix protein
VPESPTLAELKRQLDEAARMVAALNLQVTALFDAQKKLDEKVEEKDSLSRKSSEVCRQVNINTASAEELQKITEVGPVISQRIIAARLFSALNELETKVKGIGPKTLQKIIDQGCAFAAGCALGGSAASSSAGMIVGFGIAAVFEVAFFVRPDSAGRRAAEVFVILFFGVSGMR